MTRAPNWRIVCFASCLGLAASSLVAERQDELALREAVLRYLIDTYDRMEEQFDDPVGRRYCLAFDASPTSDGRAVPTEFLGRFGDHSRVHPKKWCRWHKGRLLSVGPVEWLSPVGAKVWSFSWVKSRPGGVDCLRRAKRLTSGWEISESCEKGAIYN